MAPPQSIRALLNGVLDYAGLFPPARLGMAEAVAGYARHREDDRSWLLSRFICPAARLTEMESAGAGPSPAGAPWPVSVLGRGAAETSDYLAGLREDLDLVDAYRGRQKDAATAEVLELPLPPSRAGDPEALRDNLLETLSVLTEHPARPETVFFEIGFGPEWVRRVPAAILAVSEHARGPVAAGLKIRTGGMTPDAFPTTEQVATFITAARDTGVFFKATAGLHHPLRRRMEMDGAGMHGFLNVFGGAVLSHVLDWDAATLRSALDEEDAGRFVFDETGLRWGDRGVGLPDIEAARKSFAISFGSCSFTEPVEDLESLGLI